jgi:hypothetical protein
MFEITLCSGKLVTVRKQKIRKFSGKSKEIKNYFEQWNRSVVVMLD